MNEKVATGLAHLKNALLTSTQKTSLLVKISIGKVLNNFIFVFIVLILITEINFSRGLVVKSSIDEKYSINFLAKVVETERQ